MTGRFEKPLTKKWDYPGTVENNVVIKSHNCPMNSFFPFLHIYSLIDMARQAGNDALRDAGISYNDVDAVVASYCYGDPAAGTILARN